MCCYWIFRSFTVERRIRRLMAEVASLRMEHHDSNSSSFISQEPRMEVSTTTISEKVVGKEIRVLDTYDTAKQLIKEGKDLSKVAAITGISVSELRLLDKFESRDL